jgi:DNA polymerase III alpha subunit
MHGMIIDKYGQQIFSENDLFDIFMENPELELSDVLVNTDIVNKLDIKFPTLKRYDSTDMSVDEFDSDNQNHWFIPENYKNLNIVEYILSLCNSDIEFDRVGKELILYQEKNLFDLLRYLKYLVDIMREHNIVWGVGRGSSVSSYVLFLLGVHKINSIEYDLPIDEFLK